MHKVLVTGGAGFIGGCFIRGWLAEPEQAIVNLDKLTYAGNLRSLASCESSPNYRFVQGDILDGPLVGQLLATERPQSIVHFAAESHVDRSIDGPREFLRTNVLGTFELLESTLEYWRQLASDERDHFRFLHVSTDEVYGSLGADGKFTEQSPYAPNSPYSASKAAADHFVRAFHHTYGLPTLTTNCSNNYGPFQFPEKLIPLIILNALDGRPLPVYGDGMQVRDWLHVEDHCRALRIVLKRGRPGEVYHIGGECELSNLELVRTVCKIVDQSRSAAGVSSESLIRFVADRPGHDRRYAMDIEKIKRELNWCPSVPFQDGLRETIEWYRTHRDWIAELDASKAARNRLGLGNKQNRLRHKED